MSMKWTAKQLKDYQNKRQVDAQNKPPAKSVTTKYKSKWEAQMAYDLEFRRLLPDGHADKITAWYYEPMKLKICENTIGGTKVTYYIPDFMVIYPPKYIDDEPIYKIELLEVKGYIRQLARLKYNLAVQMYPCYCWRMVKREKGKWVEI